MRCWTHFLTPWNGETPHGNPANFAAFISRHYLFYRGLLALLTKRLSITSLPPRELRDVIAMIIDAFPRGVLAILVRCDEELRHPAGNAFSSQKSALLEGFRVSENSRGILDRRYSGSRWRPFQRVM